MKTILFLFSIILVAFLNVENASGQTVIDYTTWTPNTNCNLFATGPIINGFEHRSVLGKPTYETLNKSIVLESDIFNSQTRGTSFRINYNFKKGYTYKITIKAWRQKGTSTSSDIRLRSELVNSSTTYSSCLGPDFNNNFGGSTATSQYNDINTGTDKDYIYNFNTLQSAFSYLVVGALINFNSTIQLAFIKKITIEETAPELVLAPSTVATTCGILTPQTFTVTNPSGMEGITSYEWNLGSASNGWLYNGNPAPQIITTTGNAISLTPVGNATTVNNVGVTIKVNNATFKSYTSTVTRNTLVPIITGLAQICSSENYSIPNLPAGATITWSVSGTYIINGSNTSNSVNVQATTGNGAGILTATIGAVCGSTFTVTKNISPIQLEITPFGSGDCGHAYTSINLPNGNNYAWTVTGDLAIDFGGQSLNTTSNSVEITGTEGDISLSVVACGSTINLSKHYKAYNPELLISANPMFGSDPLSASVINLGVNFTSIDWYIDNSYWSTDYNLFETNAPCGTHTLKAVIQLECGATITTEEIEFERYCSSWRSSVVVYPNPASTELKITYAPDVNSMIEMEALVSKEIKLYNEKGKALIVSEIKRGEKEIVFDIRNIPDGTYYLHVTEGKEIVKKQIIVKH